MCTSRLQYNVSFSVKPTIITVRPAKHPLTRCLLRKQDLKGLKEQLSFSFNRLKDVHGLEEIQQIRKECHYIRQDCLELNQDFKRMQCVATAAEVINAGVFLGSLLALAAFIKISNDHGLSYPSR